MPKLKKPVDEYPNARFVGYARVSTKEQNLDLQTEALKRAGVMDNNLHVEKLSATSKRRPALDLAIMDCRPGDTFLVWRLDRLARNQEEFHRRLKEIYEKGTAFKSLTEHFDFTTFTGKFILTILAAVAELERQIIRSRTVAGIQTAKDKVKRGEWKWGKPVFMTKERIALVGDHLHGRNGKKKMSGPQIAKKLGVSTASIYAFWKQTGPGKYARKTPKPKKPKTD